MDLFLVDAEFMNIAAGEYGGTGSDRRGTPLKIVFQPKPADPLQIIYTLVTAA